MPAVLRIKTEISLNANVGLVGPLKLEKSIAVDEWYGPYTLEVATASVEVATGIFTANIGLTTMTAFAIFSDQTISVTYGLAASNAPVTLTANGFHVMQDTSLTEVTLSNSSGNTANVTIFAAGT